MKRYASLLLLALLTLPIPNPAQATFPTPKVLHWQDGSNEQDDPEFKRIRELVAAKDYAPALDLLEQKIKAASHKDTALVLKGIVLNEMGKPREALEPLLQASQMERRHPALGFARCQVYRHLGKTELSDSACKIALDQHQDAPEVRYELAQILVSQGQMERANEELATAAQLDPKNTRYHFERGMNFFYLNRPEDAEKEFLKAVAIDPADLDSLYQLAYVYAKRGQTEKAEARIDKIFASPKKNDPNVQSAKILKDYISKGATDRLPMETVPYQYHFQRSQALYKAEKYGLSLLELETAARLKPDDLKIQEVLVGLYGVLFRIKESEQAVRHFLDMTQGNPTLQAKANQELGDVYVILGKFEEARKFYEKSQTLGDPNSLAKISLAEITKAAAAPAMPYNGNDIHIDPAEGLNHKGEVFAHYGMNERALGIFSMVIKMSPNHLMAKLNMAASYYNNQEYIKAISILERVLLQQPNHEHQLAHRILLARAYTQQGDFEPAIKNLGIVLKLNPEVKTRIEGDPAFKKLQSQDAYKKLFR
jgi:tetratricopeptide (TPR) repeat protein